MPLCREIVTRPQILDIEIEVTQKNSSQLNCTPSGTNNRHCVMIFNSSPCRVKTKVARSTTGSRVKFESQQSSTSYANYRTDKDYLKPMPPSPGFFNTPAPTKNPFNCGIKIVSTAPPLDIIETKIDYEEISANPRKGTINEDIAVRL